MADASAWPERQETRCHCCGQWSVPERLEVHTNPAQHGRWRVIKVAGQELGTHVITHQHGLCCTRHAHGVLAQQHGQSRPLTLAALAQVHGWACREGDAQEKAGMADKRRCICCGEVTHPDKLDLRPDLNKPGTWCVVEVHGAPGAPYVHTHQRQSCCQAHAVIIAGLIALNAATDAIRATIAAW